MTLKKNNNKNNTESSQVKKCLVAENSFFSKVIVKLWALDQHVNETVKRNCSRHGFLYIRGWMQMVLAPNDLFSWNNNTMKRNFCTDMLHYCWLMRNDTYSVHDHSLKPWWGGLPWRCDGVVFLALRHFLRLLSSPVQTQLMLIVPCWGPGTPHPQSGVPSPRVPAHSPPQGTEQ